MKISKICNFKYNYNFNPKIKHNIFCIVLFRLKNLYKTFDTYLYGLEEIIKYLSQHDKIVNDIKFRIIYSKSIFKTENQHEFNKISDVIKKANNCKHIQLVEFDCPTYKLDEIYDKGIFPFFLRYLYFFNFEDNDVNYIYASDIDFTPHKIKQNIIKFLINTFNNIIVNNINFSFQTSRCYIPFWKKKISKNDSISVLGGIVGGNVKLDYNIIIDFLQECNNTINSKNKLISNFYKNYIEYLHDNTIPYKYKIKKIKSYESNRTFVYGLDEFFLTYFVLPIILNNTNIKNIYEKVTNVTPGGLFVLLRELLKNVIEKNNHTKTINLYNKILSYILNKKIKIDDTVKTLKNFINIFEKHDYAGETDKSMLYNKFYNKMIKLINSNDKNYLKLNNKYIKCFILNDKYFTDKNNFCEITAKKRKIYYNLLKQ